MKFVALLLSCLALPAPAASLADFSLAPTYYWQQRIGAGSTIQVGWTPVVIDAKWVALRAALNVFPLNAQDSHTVVAVDAGALVDWTFSPLVTFETGASLQDWFGYGGAVPAAHANLAFPIGETIWGLLPLDRIYLGYARLFATNPTHELSLGLGVVL